MTRKISGRAIFSANRHRGLWNKRNSRRILGLALGHGRSNTAAVAAAAVRRANSSGDPGA
jgi:hypothetical protein